MAILQEQNAVFYHPLDDLTESLQTQVWNGFGVSFATGKVSDALTGGTANADTPSAYPTVVGGEHLTFAAWTRSLGPSVFIGPPPQFFEETDRNMMIAMGFPASELGGFT